MTFMLLIGSQVVAEEEEQDWSGMYAGAFGGYVSGELNSVDLLHEESTGDYDDDSPIFGISLGYQHQHKNGWVAGAEAIIPLYMQKGTAVDKEFFPDSVTYEASFKWGFLVAVKAGRGVGKLLPYAFGAVGFSNVDGKTFNVNENDMYEEGFEQSAAATHMIWQLGAGADYQVNKSIVLGGRVAAFTGTKEDHTMPWNEPGPNLFGYNSVLFQFNIFYKFGAK